MSSSQQQNYPLPASPMSSTSSVPSGNQQSPSPSNPQILQTAAGPAVAPQVQPPPQQYMHPQATYSPYPAGQPVPYPPYQQMPMNQGMQQPYYPPPHLQPIPYAYANNSSFISQNKEETAGEIAQDVCKEVCIHILIRFAVLFIILVIIGFIGLASN